MQIVINNKTYQVPELTFHHTKIMEQMGLPLEGLVNRKYLQTSISAFVAIVAKCEPDEADRLIEQHVLGGGDLRDIYKVYVDALNNSGFFKELLNAQEEEKKPVKAVKVAKKLETAAEE